MKKFIYQVIKRTNDQEDTVYEGVDFKEALKDYKQAKFDAEWNIRCSKRQYPLYNHDAFILLEKFYYDEEIKDFIEETIYSKVIKANEIKY